MSRVPIPPAVQLDRDAQGRADALAEQDPAELGPLRLGAEVPDGRRQALAEGYRTRALGEPLLAVLDGLGGLVGGAGPAQLAVGVDQHEPGGVGGEQLVGPIGDLLQGRGYTSHGTPTGRRPPPEGRLSHALAGSSYNRRVPLGRRRNPQSRMVE